MSLNRHLGSAFAMMAAPALLATIAASYTAFWFFNASQLKSRLSAWAEAERANGQVITFTIKGTSGFPTHLTLDLTGVNIGWHQQGTVWAIQTPEMRVSGGAISPHSLGITLPKGTAFSQTDDQGLIRLRKIQGETRIDLTLDGNDGIRDAVLTTTNLQLEGQWYGETLTSPFMVGNANAMISLPPPQTSTAGDATPVARLDISAKDVRWPDNFTTPLGTKMENLEISTKASAPLPRRDLPIRDGLDQWREAGGRVEVERLNLRWGEAAVAGFGTLLLDDNLQPAISLTARVEGFIPLVDALDATGVIRPSDATMARLVLGRQMPRNGAGNLSLTLRNSVVYAGPLALLRVPKVAWPEPPNAVKHRTPTGEPIMQPGVDIDKSGNPVRRNP